MYGASPRLIEDTRFLASTCDSEDQDWETLAAYWPKIFDTACIEVLMRVGDGEWGKLGARIEEIALRGDDNSLQSQSQSS